MRVIKIFSNFSNDLLHHFSVNTWIIRRTRSLTLAVLNSNKWKACVSDIIADRNYEVNWTHFHLKVQLRFIFLCHIITILSETRSRARAQDAGGIFRKHRRGNRAWRLITLMDKKCYRKHAKQSAVCSQASGLSDAVCLSRTVVACRASSRRTYLIKLPPIPPPHTHYIN